MKHLRGYMPSRSAMADPLFVVEELGEWRMEVYPDFIMTVDYYEGFAEIMFVAENVLNDS